MKKHLIAIAYSFGGALIAVALLLLVVKLKQDGTDYKFAIKGKDGDGATE